MTIVTTRPRKRAVRPAQAATIKVPRIVQHTPKGRAWRLPPDDPEAKARAVAFLSGWGSGQGKGSRGESRDGYHMPPRIGQMPPVRSGAARGVPVG